MREMKIPKRSGGFRNIVVPSEQEKARLREFMPNLNDYKYNQYTHGFVPGRSPVTNAKAHVGYDVSISFDLKDFFDTVTEEHLSGKVPKEVLDVCLYKGRTAQGLPTSPALANIAAQKLDDAIVRWLKKKRYDFSYTRYADDLTISMRKVHRKDIRDVQKQVKTIVSNCRFKINEKKTLVQFASSGNRVICGVSVGKNSILATKQHRHKLRALKHKLAHGEPRMRKQVAGLTEWCTMRQPLDPDIRRKIRAKYTMFKEANLLLRKYHIRGRMVPIEKAISELNDGDFSITNDPRYFACMSTVGNSWRSCMHLADGQYSHGVVFWQQMPGTSVAILWGKTHKNIHGVTLRTMAARALVHKRRDGALIFDRIYGGPEAGQKLCTKLMDLGYRPSSNENWVAGGYDVEYKGYSLRWYVAGGPERIIGNVPRDKYILPYFDNVQCRRMSDNVNGEKIPVWVCSI